MIRSIRMATLLVGIAVASHAYAEDPPVAPKAADAEGFVPVKNGEAVAPGETLPATGLVAGAYGFIMASLVVWIASVAMRSRRVEEELDALRAKIDRKA